MARATLANTSEPAVSAEAITNDVDFSRACRAIYVGGAGNIVLELEDDSVVYFAGAVAGTVIPVRAKSVLASSGGNSTSATNLVALL